VTLKPEFPELSPDPSPRTAAQAHVVVLVHGIRDFALWQTTVRTTLEEAGFKAEATNYGRFNLPSISYSVSIFPEKGN
jgi:hypothetical protein